MIRVTLSCVLASLVLFPSGALAQEQEPPQTLIIEQWICDFDQLEAIEEVLSRRHEIYQELVNEGVLIAWGVYYHAWGDEWNVNAYTVGRDKAAVFSAWENDVIPRLNERYPDLLNIYDHDVCSAHRDNIYRMGVTTQPPSDP